MNYPYMFPTHRKQRNHNTTKDSKDGIFQGPLDVYLLPVNILVSECL